MYSQVTFPKSHSLVGYWKPSRVLSNLLPWSFTVKFFAIMLRGFCMYTDFTSSLPTLPLVSEDFLCRTNSVHSNSSVSPAQHTGNSRSLTSHRRLCGWGLGVNYTFLLRITHLFETFILKLVGASLSFPEGGDPGLPPPNWESQSQTLFSSMSDDPGKEEFPREHWKKKQFLALSPHKYISSKLLYFTRKRNPFLKAHAQVSV